MSEQKIIVYRNQSEVLLDHALISGDLAYFLGGLLLLLVFCYSLMRLAERNYKKRYGRKT